MPFLKHNDPSSPVADANDSSHKCLWVALPNAELNKQLRACTQAFAEWTGVDPNMGFRYRDMVAWTAEVAGIASDMDRRSYIQFYFGMQDKPGGLSAAWYRRRILGGASIHFGMDSVLARRSSVLGFAEAEIDRAVFVRIRDRRTIRGGQGGDLPPKIRSRARTIAPGETYRAVY